MTYMFKHTWLRLISVTFLVTVLITITWIIYDIYSLDISGSTNEHVVKYEKLGLQIIVRAKVLGIGGNSEISLFKLLDENDSNKKHMSESLGHELVTFKGISELYYRKQNESTLTIYVSSEGVTKEQKTQFGELNININQLKNFNDLKNFERNYKEYGLLKISAYDKNTKK